MPRIFRPASFLIASLVAFVIARLKAALNHKTVNHTVENGVVVKTFAAVVGKFLTVFRRFIIKGFDYDIAVLIVESNHFASCSRGGALARNGAHIGACYSITVAAICKGCAASVSTICIIRRLLPTHVYTESSMLKIF